jgi:hypothetical protein
MYTNPSRKRLGKWALRLQVECLEDRTTPTALVAVDTFASFTEHAGAMPSFVRDQTIVSVETESYPGSIVSTQVILTQWFAPGLALRGSVVGLVVETYGFVVSPEISGQTNNDARHMLSTATEDEGERVTTITVKDDQSKAEQVSVSIGVIERNGNNAAADLSTKATSPPLLGSPTANAMSTINPLPRAASAGDGPPGMLAPFNQQGVALANGPIASDTGLANGLGLGGGNQTNLVARPENIPPLPYSGLNLGPSSLPSGAAEMGLPLSIPQVAGSWQDPPFANLSDLDMALRGFLEEVGTNVDQAIESRARGGLAPWAVAVAIAGAAVEVARRQLRRTVVEMGLDSSSARSSGVRLGEPGIRS